MSHIFRALCQKKPNHWFYLYKKCTIKTCIFIQKRQVSFVKKPYHYQWFNLLLLKPTPPQKLLYKPRLFYSNHPIHRNIELWTTSTTWTPAGLSSPGPSSPTTRSSTTGCWIPPRPQGRRSSRSPKASLRTSSLRPSYQPLEEFAKAGSSPTLEIIFGRLLSPKKLRHHLQLSWKN